MFGLFLVVSLNGLPGSWAMVVVAMAKTINKMIAVRIMIPLKK